MSLPIYNSKEEILNALKGNSAGRSPVLVLVGETGCGKTTRKAPLPSLVPHNSVIFMLQMQNVDGIKTPWS